jgi:hypothetical protein
MLSLLQPFAGVRLFIPANYGLLMQDSTFFLRLDGLISGLHPGRYINGTFGSGAGISHTREKFQIKTSLS